MSNVFGTPGNDVLTGGQEADYIWARSGNDTVYGGAGDVLNGEDGDDVFIATESYKIDGLSGTDTLISNYSQSNYGSGIHLNATGNFPGIQAIEPRTYLLGFDSDIEALNVTGTQYNDILDGGMKNVTLEGGAGNDALFGLKGVFSGGSGTDTLTADYNQSSSITYGVHLGLKGENTVRRRDDGSVILTHNGIETLNFTGTDLLDYLSGQNGDDVLDGRGGNDVLEGGAGNDRLLDVSGSDTLSGGEGDDYLYTVADIKGATKQLYGGRGADTFIVDLKNEINLGFEFDTAKLGNFVNAITLPENNGPDWKRVGIDVAFAAVGAGVGAVPVVGSLFNFWTSLAQTGVDTYLDQKELQAQIDQQITKTNQAVKHYGTADWGKVSPSGTRDVIYINDFQIGLDNIVLPQLPAANYFYQVDLVEGQGGGVFLSVRNPGLEQFKNVAFIANTYTNVSITDLQFKGLVADLIQGSTIGTFTKTPIVGDNNTSVTEIIGAGRSTFANDNIQANGGDDEVFGYYGDDVIQGGDGNDTIFGGSNQNSYYIEKLEPNYENDGNDIINGGAGNDAIKGESGNDFINGDSGNDILNGGLGNNTLLGGTGNDILTNTNGVVNGGADTDTLVADYSQMNNGAGVDVAYNNAEAIYTRINGDPTLNYSNIEQFNVTGTQYADVLRGGASSDTLTGGAANDLITGGAGDDLLIDTDANVDGGAGNDTLVANYSQLNNGAGVHVGYNSQNAIFSRLNGSIVLNYSNIEQFNVTGTQYADVLLGGTGGDTLTGGAGNDQLTGGAGADNFRFNSPNEGVDQIADFLVVDDTIQVSATGFGGGLTAGSAIAASQFAIGASAQNTSDRFIYNSQTGALFFDIDGLGGATQTQIATLSTGLAMTNNDIFALA
ncbi:calcium-binding protein [Microcoleus sp. S13_C5]|uniref:calcium-binding protein n=1 Tax=Microcoleus sp. S13_C5 TaxID=3055411 RepID=UPI002FCF5A17